MSLPLAMVVTGGVLAAFGLTAEAVTDADWWPAHVLTAGGLVLALLAVLTQAVQAGTGWSGAVSLLALLGGVAVLTGWALLAARWGRRP